MREVRAKHASLAAENHGMKLITTNEHFVKFCTFFSKPFNFKGLAKCLLALAVIVPGTAAQGQQPSSTALVGEVSLVLGKAYIESPERDRRQVEVGSPVRVMDQISTGANGHVHIRFVDQALVSVRPDSLLEVERYQYDAARPEQSAVKFNLVEGITRSISGEAARSARQRFRLNTPIAAIGVRGTDFVVSATSDSVRALVNEGTIVMAPYSEECSAEALGPCADNAIELSGDSLQIVELSANAPATTLANQEGDSGLLRDEAQSVIANNSTTTTEESQAEEKATGSEVYLEGVTSQKVTADAEQVAQAGTETETEVEIEPPPPLIDFTPQEPLDEQAIADRQLVWGRWSWAQGQGDLERITFDYSVASEDRDVTITSGDYALFRDENGELTRVNPYLGVVGFELNSAQAFYSSESGIVAMRVGGGSLDIDFGNDSFETSLELDHASTGLINFSAIGRIQSGGFLQYRSDSKNVIGAVSFDGTEAGYYFDQQLDDGGIQGLTLWDSR
jgi:hypothetical protein